MNPTKNWGELRCSGGESSSCSISGTRCVTLIVTNPVISHEWGKYELLLGQTEYHRGRNKNCK